MPDVLITDKDENKKGSISNSFSAGYSQSDYVKPKNNKNLEKKISLNTNVDFNSNISAIAEYDIHLDENKPNSFGVGLRFH